MNKKVGWLVIALLWVSFIGFAVTKLFFAEQFLAVIHNENLIAIGNAIDGNPKLRLAADIFVSVFLMQFYLCACKQVWRLHTYQYLIFFVYISLINIGYLWNPAATMIVDLVGMIVFPLILGAKLKQVVSIFVLHQAGQLLTLFIRSEPLYLASTDYATQFVLVFDMYLWLAIYYTYSNIYKEETLWEKLLHPFSGIKRKRNSQEKS